ncbi:MAG: D-alanyl-D-alanine carboxypeptidase family protein [Armatimonadota bacterium]
MASVVLLVLCEGPGIAQEVTGSASDSPLEISAPSAILIDSRSGIVLWQREPHTSMYPASLTKMMTGLLCVEKGNLDDVVTVSARAAAVGEASLNLSASETLTLRELLQGLLIKSANDASVAIAEHIAGDLETFIAMMNTRARELGMMGTHFENPHGLHSDNHVSTAADLATLARGVMAVPELAEICDTERAVIPWEGKTWSRELVNRNRLLLQWEECDGIKTGWTTQAGRCLAASATRNDERLICVVLDCEDAWTDAEALLRWGFKQYRHETVIRTGPTGRTAHVLKGKKARVQLAATQSLILPVRTSRGIPKPQMNIAPVEAPVHRGQALGELQLSYRGHTYHVPLVAVDDVEKSFWATAVDTCLPKISLWLLLALSVGVLLHGAVTKIALARRHRLEKRRRRPHSRRTSEREWRDRYRTRDESRS